MQLALNDSSQEKLKSGRYVVLASQNYITVQQVRLRWLETSEAHSSPLLQTRGFPVIPRVTHTHTLKIMRTDLKAVATRQPGFPNPEQTKKSLWNLEVFKRRRGQKLKSKSRRQLTAYRA